MGDMPAAIAENHIWIRAQNGRSISVLTQILGKPLVRPVRPEKV